ncbi:MAG: hypothetical protein K0S61_3418 [Anaerocolumna sp.]|nr:hypothetical protein [Anaerocolumna sp.]
MTKREDNCKANYIYKPVSVPGGGFVTGFVFHPRVADILYCRTDIGGIYRYDFKKESWIALIDSTTDPECYKTYPLSIALDANHPEYIYSMVGENPVYKIGFSKDYGEHFNYYDAPVVDDAGNQAAIHGNAPGRATGERLVVDPHDSNVLYMGTMENGLWKTTNRCKTWEKVDVCVLEGKPEKNIAFVEIDSYSGGGTSASKRIVVATSGEMSSADGNVRGQSVYITNDGGKSFQPLHKEPQPIITGPSDHPGFVGQRAVFAGKYLYITYSAYNIGWSNFASYGCDTGKCYDGALYRYELDQDGNVVEALDITPPRINKWEEEVLGRRIGYGMGGLGADSNNPGTIICSTITASPDTIYHSNDFGITWTPILSGLTIGKLDFNVSYQKPEYNGMDSLIHWMSDIKINPFNSNMAIFNTGAGVFMTNNLSDSDKGESVTWHCFNNGIEETVHLNIYSPPGGDVKLIDIIGDYGGFVFKDLDRPAENTFADYKRDRWITAMNADYPDRNPSLLVVTPRGNWKGKTKGGLIISYNQGDTWEQLNDPIGINKDIDKQIALLKRPNVTSGWVAISADGVTISWTVGEPLLSNRITFTNDWGINWSQAIVYSDASKTQPQSPIPFKVMADRVNPDIFYGFSKVDDQGGFYISKDKGATFYNRKAPEGFPKVDLAGIDSKQDYEIRIESGSEGTIWIAMNENGLWKITYDMEKDSFQGVRKSKAGDVIKRIGLGKEAPESDKKTLFTSGTVEGEYGFYLSLDEGVSWIRINDDEHQYGDIRSIAGDPRVFGRIYVATGTRGVVYGERVVENRI